MKMYKYIIPFFIIILSNSCCRIDSKCNCFGASSPVDIILNNPGDNDLIISLYEHCDESGFDLLGTLLVKANGQKKICLESEGPIQDGLFLYFNDNTFKIKLSYPEEFIINLTDTLYQIETIPALDYLRDPKW